MSKRENYFAKELREAYDNANKTRLTETLAGNGWIDEDCKTDEDLYKTFIAYMLNLVEFEAQEVGVSMCCNDNYTIEQLVKEGE